MFGLSLKEKITKQIALACGNSAVRLKRDLIDVYESNPNGNHQEEIVFLLDMFLTTVQVNVLDYYTEGERNVKTGKRRNCEHPP